MRLKLNLTGFLDQGDQNAIPYLLKMYLRDIEKLPIVIDPKNPGIEEIIAEHGILSYEYQVNDEGFFVELNYKPE